MFKLDSVTLADMDIDGTLHGNKTLTMKRPEAVTLLEPNRIRNVGQYSVMFKTCRFVLLIFYFGSLCFDSIKISALLIAVCLWNHCACNSLLQQ